MAGIGTFKLIKLYQYTVAKDATGNNTETEALRYRIERINEKRFNWLIRAEG